MPTPRTPSIIQADSLFKNWVELCPAGGQVASTFRDYQLIEREEDEWTEIDNSEAVRAQHAYLKKYAAGEQWAHELAYQDLKANPIQQVIEDDGSLREYRCQALNTTNPGLVAYALTPTQLKPGEKPDIKIIFRGTKPSSKDSVYRDLEPGGAGAISFAKDRDLILEQINQIAKEFDQGLTLTIAGHSLGGADAQNAAAAVIEAVAQNKGISYVARDKETPAIPSECCDNLSQVEHLRLFTYNSAGIPQATAERSQSLVALLAEKRAKGEQIPTIESYNQQVGGDGVQQTGEAHLLSNVSGRCAKVDVLKAHIGSEHHHKLGLSTSLALGTLLTATAGVPGFALASTATVASVALGLKDTKKSHCDHLHAAPRAVQYESFSNTTPGGQAKVHAQLNNKSAWLNTLHRGGASIYNGMQTWTQKAAITLGYSSSRAQQGVTVEPKPQATEEGSTRKPCSPKPSPFRPWSWFV